MPFTIKKDVKMIQFYDWYGRKIPVAKGTPVTMATLYILAVYVLFILLLHQGELVKPENTKNSNYGCITFCMILSRSTS